MADAILRIAVPAPLFRLFDYQPPEGSAPAEWVPGKRVRVPFGASHKVGVLWATAESSDVPGHRLRRALAILDHQPVLPPASLALARWASDYYHHPLGEVLGAMLPGPLRRGRPAQTYPPQAWRPTAAGLTQRPDGLGRAKQQAAVLTRLQQAPEGVTAEAFGDLGGDWRRALKALVAKGWAEAVTASPPPPDPEPGPALNSAQQAAVDRLTADGHRFQVHLLDGVTGSGKTEVYLQLIARVMAAGEQALVLVPEIALTPQLVDRFRRRLGTEPTVLHSGRAEQERLSGWLAAQQGRTSLILGTRSAVFVPLAAPGIFIVDEEHDPSLKQHEGFRYSARDLAVVRGRMAERPVVLGSATPSLESLDNVARGRYQRVALPERAGSAALPRIRTLDLRGQPIQEGGIAEPLVALMGEHLAAGGQVLTFLNRRGYAPTLLCHECGWTAECTRCDSHLIFHRGSGEMRCHHCDHRRGVPPQCPDCGSTDLRAIGYGTEQVERALAQTFPEAGIVRIDRDSTRAKGALEARLAAVRHGEARILIGTQMLAKGHHFPGVTLVGILDGDQGLFGADFRAPERMAQLILQVAGRAGRADRPGEVVVQTHHPDHPLLTRLIDEGYGAFADTALHERYEAGLPPASSLALLRAESPRRDQTWAFLEAALAAAQDRAVPGVELLGPLPAPMERRAGRYRAQLLLRAQERARLHRLLADWVPALAELEPARRARWAIDVDPLDTL